MVKKNNKVSGITVFYLLVACGFAFCFILAICHSINKATNEQQIVATVTDKIVTYSPFRHRSRYLIVAQDESDETYVIEIPNKLLKLDDDAIEICSQIKNDTKYQFSVKGSRVRALSWYPNLYGLEEINE